MKHDPLPTMRELNLDEIRLVNGGDSTVEYQDNQVKVIDHFDGAGNYTGTDYEFTDGSLDHYDYATESMEHFDAVNICAGASAAYVMGEFCSGAANDGGEWALRMGIVAEPEARPQLEAVEGAHIQGLDHGTDSVTYGVTGTSITQTTNTAEQGITSVLAAGLRAWIQSTNPDAAAYIYGDGAHNYSERTINSQ